MIDTSSGRSGSTERKLPNCLRSVDSAVTLSIMLTDMRLVAHRDSCGGQV